ncbi:MAG: LuxR C-terminal-related transcriptional regulator [Anaerolineales bacterium]
MNRISDQFGHIIFSGGLFPISTSPHNLPVQFIPIVGREKEIGDLVSLLKNPEVGLITLHGFGGTGKTRLAVELGRAALEMFPDGVWFVALAPLSLPEHIITATASAMGFSFQGLDDQKSQLIRYLHNKQLLLILDNLEHLLPEGATYIEELLQNATEAKLLVTSRQPLNMVWEWVYPLHGLEYETGSSRTEEEIPAAVQLFLQHLSRAGSRSVENDPACAAQVCQMVNGLPLALLLAASWGRTLGCTEIIQEIQNSIRFLQAHQKTFPEKHSSMQAVFDYSWQLLSDREQAALRKISVFRGGFDRIAAAKVAAADLALLAALVDHSLIERVSQDRYQIHELLRQYLQERLVDAGEEKITRNQHLAYYTRLAEQAEPELTEKNQREWFRKLQTEIDNIRAALAWSLASNEDVNLEKGLSLMASSGRFWQIHNVQQGYAYLLPMLGPRLDRLAYGSYAHTFARALNVAGMLSFLLKDWPATRRFGAEALRIGLELNDARLVGDAYYRQGVEAVDRGESIIARSAGERALEYYRQIEYLTGTTQALNLLGRNELFSGAFSAAFAHLSAALELARNLEDLRNIYLVLRSLGDLAFSDPQIGYHRARDYYAEALEYAREMNDKMVIALLLNSMGDIARLEGKFEQAAAILEETDSICEELGQKGLRIVPQLNVGFVYSRLGKYDQSQRIFTNILVNTQFEDHQNVELSLCLLGLAGLAVVDGKAQLAAKVLGAIEVHKEPFLLWPPDRNDYERIFAAVKAQLTDKQFNQLHTDGQALSLADAAQLILAQGTKEKGPDVARLDQLTKREIEILRLVAQGLSDAQVAERLVLSPRTVNAHLTSIYNKLGVNSRSAATRYAMEHG